MWRAAVEHHQERFVPVQGCFLNGWRQNNVCADIWCRADLGIFPQIDIMDANPVAQPFQPLGGDKGGLITLFLRVGEDIGGFRFIGPVVIRLAQIIHQHRDGHAGGHGVGDNQAARTLILLEQRFQLGRGIAFVAQSADVMRIKAFTYRQKNRIFTRARILNRFDLVGIVVGQILVFA